MSENKESKGNFEIVEQINKKYFTELELSVPHLQQSLFDLQNECYKTWKNSVTANIEFQKEFLSTSGFNYVIPDTAKTILENMSEEAIKYRAYCNKIAIANIESVKKNAKTYNDSAESFIDLNRKIMHFWISAFLPKRN